jgi:hypothetical protein
MSIVYEPPVLNQRSSPDQTLWEAIVVYDTTASCVVRVYARNEAEANEFMTDRDALYQSDAEFEMDANWIREFYTNDIEPVNEEKDS